MTAEHNDNNIQAPPVIGPGEQLRTARLAAGLDKDRVAAQLHLKPAQIDELERDHFDGFAARVFVRGYLRNYARLVGLSDADILKAYDSLSPDPAEPRLKRVGSHRPQVSSRHGLVRLISWLLVIGIVVLFGVWWAGYLELNGNGRAIQPTSEAPAASDSPVEQPEEPGVLSLPPAPAVDETASEPAGEPLPEPEPITDPVEAEPDEAELMPPPVAAEAPAVTEQPAPVVVDAPAPSEPAPLAAAPAGEIVLTLDGPCWVEVRATDGSFKLLGSFDAGTRRVLGGNPPYRILLGNAKAASLTVDGQPFDLVPHTRQQVARFELDPTAL